MERTPFSTADGAPRLAGWRAGAGPPALLLHGGPGLSYDYLDDLAGELAGDFEVASFQQRGLAPSGEEGPFTVDAHVGDVARVLDALGWERAFVIGHSWGGHLALHVAAALPERLLGALVVDPLGAVGDGGQQAFDEEIFARTPEDARARARELDEAMMRGEGTVGDAIENMALVWPAYFGDPPSAPAMPPVRMSLECLGGTFASLREELPRLEAALPTIDVPVGFVHGERSPMPATASTDAAARIPGAWVEIAPRAGHFVWHEAPGAVRRGALRLAAGDGP